MTDEPREPDDGRLSIPPPDHSPSEQHQDCRERGHNRAGGQPPCGRPRWTHPAACTQATLPQDHYMHRRNPAWPPLPCGATPLRLPDRQPDAPSSPSNGVLGRVWASAQAPCGKVSQPCRACQPDGIGPPIRNRDSLPPGHRGRCLPSCQSGAEWQQATPA